MIPRPRLSLHFRESMLVGRINTSDEKEEDFMLLQDKVAVVYGGGGAIGGSVARAFAREGAKVYLAGRTRQKLERVAEDIRSGGGLVHVGVVDALDEAAVRAHVDAVVA